MTVRNSFPSRAEKARELAESDRIRIDGDVIRVGSSDGQTEYVIREIGGRAVCNCLGFANRQDCYHVRGAARWAQQQEQAR